MLEPSFDRRNGFDDSCAPITFAERRKIRAPVFRVGAGLRALDRDRAGSLEHPRTLDIVGDAHDLLADHLEADCRERRQPVGIVTHDDDDRLAVHSAERHSPRDDGTLVFDEVGRVGEASRKTVGHTQACVGAGELAHAVPVASIESIDIEAKQFRCFRVRRRLAFRLLGKRREFSTAAIEGGLDAADRGIDEIGDFVERIVEYVLEQHAGSLLGRKVQYEPLDGAVDLPTRSFDRQNQFGARGGSLGLLPDLPPAEKIDAAIVDDPEQPRLERPAVVKSVELAIGVEHGLLHHVFAIQRRAGHARAVAVQPRAEAPDGFEKCNVPRRKEAGGVEITLEVGLGFHIDLYAGERRWDTPEPNARPRNAPGWRPCLHRQRQEDRPAFSHQRAELRPLKNLQHQGPRAQHRWGSPARAARSELSGYVRGEAICCDREGPRGPARTNLQRAVDKSLSD
jgi:hypothetical protein